MSENKPELRCGSDDKVRRARHSRAYPPNFVIPSSAPSVLFSDIFWRGENAPFTYPARTNAGRGDHRERLACGLGQGSVLTIHRIVIHCRTRSLREPYRAAPQSQPKGAERADGGRRLGCSARAAGRRLGCGAFAARLFYADFTLGWFSTLHSRGIM